MIPLERRKWMVLVATIWIQAFAGTNFDFPSYSSHLKSVIQITQVELNYLSMASDFGKLFGWCSGVFLLYFPTSVVLFMAAFLGLMAYGFQWLLIQGIVSVSYLTAFTLCLSAGCSITWLNTVCFVLCIKNFPDNWPLAVPLCFSFNGVTAALYNLIASKIASDHRNTSYLMLNASLPFITSITALIPILQEPYTPQTDETVNSYNNNSKDDSYTFAFLYLLAAVTGLYLFFLDTPSQNIFVVALCLLVLPLVSPSIVYVVKWVYPVEEPSYDVVKTSGREELNEEKLVNLSNRGLWGCWVFDKMMGNDRLMVIGEEHTVRMLVSRCEFWLYYMAYFCGGTIGLVYSNNLGQISQSLGYASETKALVTLYSTCSFFGRLVSAAPDLVGCFYAPETCRKRFITRTGWLAISLVPLPVAFLLLYLSVTKAALSLATGTIGLCSGFIFTAAVSITSELFGSNSSGINHNILITNIPLGSLLYGLYAALVYDNESKNSKEVVIVGGSKVCMGQKCYNETFGFWVCVTLLGVASSFMLFLRTRAAYEQYYRRRMNWLSEESVFIL